MDQTKLDEIIAQSQTGLELQAKLLEAVKALKDPVNAGTATPEEIEAVVEAVEAFNEANDAVKVAVEALTV